MFGNYAKNVQEDEKKLKTAAGAGAKEAAAAAAGAGAAGGDGRRFGPARSAASATSQSRATPQVD